VNFIDPDGLFAPAIPYAAYELALLAGATAAYLQSPAGQAMIQNMVKSMEDTINLYAKEHTKEPSPSKWDKHTKKRPGGKEKKDDRMKWKKKFGGKKNQNNTLLYLPDSNDDQEPCY
jgi:hypothetical protein